MDSGISAAARALAVGAPLTALNHVGLRDDPPALALRGIALAQLGELVSARDLLRKAARRFGARDELARARCVVAEAEVCLAMRDLRMSPRTLSAASTALEARGDHANALHAGLLGVRRSLLLGRLDEAASALRCFDFGALPPRLRAVAELAVAELAMRSLRIAPAREALGRAHEAARAACVPALLAEVQETILAIRRPAARRSIGGHEEAIRLDEVEALFASRALVVDACRRVLRVGDIRRSMARRPVLFDLLRILAEASPTDVARNTLIERTFGARRPNESHRARLRVEIGRLRAFVTPLARIDPCESGYRLTANDKREIVVLLPPVDGANASILALLADGAAWSTSALALALGASQRSVQRALGELESAGRVRSIGRARAQRWLAPPLTGITTNLLLPIPMSLA